MVAICRRKGSVYGLEVVRLIVRFGGRAGLDAVVAKLLSVTAAIEGPLEDQGEKAMTGTLDPTLEQKATHRFDMWDSNNDGILTEDEFLRVGQGVLDADGTSEDTPKGKAVMEGIREFWARHLEGMDLDQDGTISRDEYRVAVERNIRGNEGVEAVVPYRGTVSEVLGRRGRKQSPPIRGVRQGARRLRRLPAGCRAHLRQRRRRRQRFDHTRRMAGGAPAVLDQHRPGCSWQYAVRTLLTLGRTGAGPAGTVLPLPGTAASFVAACRSSGARLKTPSRTISIGGYPWREEGMAPMRSRILGRTFDKGNRPPREAGWSRRKEGP